MSTFVEEFIKRFHSSNDLTIGQRRKGFFTYIHKNSEYMKANTEIIDQILYTLQPKTTLDELLVLEFLIYFRRSAEIHDILKEGNDIFTCKIAKQIWFFKEGFVKIDPEILVNNIIPKYSYTVRVKVLAKLARYVEPERFDAIFNCIVARYGIFMACKFIYGCSKSKIVEVLSDYKIKFKAKIAKILYAKDPDLVEIYLRQGDQYNQRGLNNFMRFLFSKNLNLYEYIVKKHNTSHMNFGRRCSKKFAQFKKAEIIANPGQFHCLQWKAVIRKFGKDSAQMVINALPTDFKDVYGIYWLVDKFPKKYKYNLYFTTIENHYNKKFYDNPEVIREYLLNFIPDNNQRAMYAKRGNINIKYFTTDESIPLIQVQIKDSPNSYQKYDLITTLIETCYINNDSTALVEVEMKHLIIYKNILNLKFILEKITKQFPLNKFTEEMWQQYAEMTSKEEMQTNLFYLDFLLHNCQQIEDLLLSYMKKANSLPKWGTYSKELEEKLLHIALKGTNGAEDSTHFNCSLINYLSLWNSHYNQEKISFTDYPCLVEAFKFSLDKKNYLNPAIKEIFRNKIFNCNHNNERSNYLDIYWEHFELHGKFIDLKWFLRHDPITIIKYLASFLKKCITLEPHFQLQLWNQAKKCDYLQLKEKVIKFCVSKIEDQECVDEKPKFIMCLSVLMNPDEYAHFAGSYKPLNKSIDLTDEDQVRLYSIQCEFAKQYKNTQSSKIMDSLLQYCVGDYLKYSLRSLYSILYRTPETMVPQYLKHISKQAVSVRKHALFLACDLTTVEEVKSIINFLLRREKTPTLQKKIFGATTNYFVKNPTDDFFELVKQCILFINKNDEESLNALTRDYLDKVPEKYKVQYIEYALDYLQKTIDVEAKLTSLKSNLFDEIKPKMCKFMSLNFGLKLIKDELKHGSHWIIILSFHFILQRTEKALIIQEIINAVNESEERTLFALYDQWYNLIIKLEEHYPFVETAVKYFEEKIHPIEHFQRHVQLTFLKIKIKLAPEKISYENCAQQIFETFQNLVSTHGPYCINFFGYQVLDFFALLPRSSQTDDPKRKLIFTFLCQYPTTDVAFMVIATLPDPTYMHSGSSLVNKTLRKLKTFSDAGLQLCLNYHYGEYMNSNYFQDEKVNSMDTE